MAEPLCSLIDLETYPECTPLQFTEYWTMSTEALTLNDLHHIEKSLRAIHGEEITEKCMLTLSGETTVACVLGGCSNDIFLHYNPSVKGIPEQQFCNLLVHLNIMERRALIYALLVKKPIDYITRLPWELAYQQTTSDVMKNILLNFNAEPFYHLAFWQREPKTFQPMMLTGLTEKVSNITGIDFSRFMKKVEVSDFDLEQFIS